MDLERIIELQELQQENSKLKKAIEILKDSLEITLDVERIELDSDVAWRMYYLYAIHNEVEIPYTKYALLSEVLGNEKKES